MKVIYTDEASKDLDGILAYIAANYPTAYDAFLIRLRSAIDRIRMLTARVSSTQSRASG